MEIKEKTLMAGEPLWDEILVRVDSVFSADSVGNFHSELKGVRVDGGRRDHGAEGEHSHEGSQTSGGKAVVSRQPRET